MVVVVEGAFIVEVVLVMATHKQRMERGSKRCPNAIQMSGLAGAVVVEGAFIVEVVPGMATRIQRLEHAPPPLHWAVDIVAGR